MLPKGLQGAGGAMALLPLLWGSSSGQSYTIGVFFDDRAQECVAEVLNFAPAIRAYVFALVPDGTLLNGALLSIDVPAGFVISGERPPHSGIGHIDGTLTGSNGLNVILQNCFLAAGPVELVSFDLKQVDSNLPSDFRVPDVRLEIKGASVPADSLVFEKPQVKICDPIDPINGKPLLVEAIPIVSTLNCTADCPCTTPVTPTTWGRVKCLFRGP